MTEKLHIESVLERSLRKQVRAPQLDGRFDAAVWSRIEAAEQRAPADLSVPSVPASARWLFIVNVIGAAVALVLAVYFGAQALGPVQVNVPAVAAPEISAGAMQLVYRLSVYAVTAGPLVFALMFTSLGRRLRAELRQFL